MKNRPNGAPQISVKKCSSCVIIGLLLVSFKKLNHNQFMKFTHFVNAKKQNK